MADPLPPQGGPRMPENAGQFEIENSHFRLQAFVAANVAASNRIVNRTVVM
jgi:hypothetical protein